MGIFTNVYNYFSADLAIDLGTANTLVYIKGRGIVLREPSMVMIDDKTGKIQAVGAEAKAMLGKTPANMRIIRPMKDGVIADFDTTEKMLQYFIKRTRSGNQFLKPRIVIGIPSEITQVERRAVRDAALRARANEVFLIEQAMAAAIGADLPITEPGGNMVVDIGGGTTDVAVISLSGIVVAKSIRIASNEMDEAIVQYIKKKYNMLIGERTAEQIKIKIGSAYPLDEPLEMEIKGRDLAQGIPKTLNINDSEVREALEGVVQALIEVVKNTLERTPPELSADIVDRGIVLCGGGALLKNLDKRFREETSLPIFVADDPLSSVVLGAGKVLENLPLLEKIGNAL
jgi:rod shape-determining protein MreB and related proteins